MLVTGIYDNFEIVEDIPFVYGRLAGQDEFTNRHEETAQLLRNFKAGINTILISPRRWGKSSLVQHSLEKVKNRNIKHCTLDLFSVRDEADFYEQLGSLVLNTMSGKLTEALTHARDFMGKLIPRIAVNADDYSQLSLSLDWKEVKKNPAQILNLAEEIARKKNIKLIICIDEFQNIAGFENPLAFQKKLRAAWQRHKHVSYCLYGSKRHMMMDVFTNPKMPFYKFGDLIFLQKINAEEWVTFITKRFDDTRKFISENDAATIASLVECHPYYTQQLAQLVWLRTAKKCQTKSIYEAHESLCNQLAMLFHMMTDDLTNTQVNFMKALLDEQPQLSSKATIETYNLGTSANVIRIREALLEKEILDYTADGLKFLDPCYSYWLKTRYFNKI